MKTKNRWGSIVIWILIVIFAFIAKDYVSIKGEIPLSVIVIVSTSFLGYQILTDRFQLKFLGQLECVYTIVLLFMSPSIYRCYDNIKSKIIVTCFWVCIMCLWFFLLFKYGRVWISLTKEYFCHNIYILFGILFLILIRIPQFGTVPKWDSQIYSYCMSDASINFDYTCSTFFRYFRIANHTSWGYVFLSVIVEFWKPFNNYTLSILGMILSVCTFIAIYEIFKIIDNIHPFFAMLIAVAVTTTPIFSGTYTNYNLDFGVACLFFILYCFWLKKYGLLTLLVAVLFCLTKEPAGILFTAGLLCCNMFKCCVQNKRIRDKFWALCHDPSNYALTFAILLCFLGYIVTLFKSEAIWGIIKQEESAINYFGLNPEYMLVKGKQILFINFAWLGVLLILICGIGILVKKRKVNYDVMALIMGTVFYLLFSFFYYTYAIPRYNMIIYMAINFVACYFISIFVQNIKFKSLLFFSLICLFSVQTYFNIDYLMLNMFPTVSTGKYSLCNTSVTEEYLGDYIVYNYMYSYFDNIILSVLKDADFTGQEELFILGNDDDSFVGGNKSLAPIYYDNRKQKWSLLPITGTIYVESHNEDVWEETSPMLSDKALAIIIPYYVVDLQKEIKRIKLHYNIEDKRTVETFYGNAEYWILNRKKESVE